MNCMAVVPRTGVTGAVVCRPQAHAVAQPVPSATDRGFLGKNFLSRGYKNYFTAATSATVTLTTASPTVITWAAHGLRPGNRVRFTTTGTFTGITSGTDYFVMLDGFTTGAFKIATSPFGAAINVTAQSGVHTAFSVAEFGSGIHGNAFLWNPTTRILTAGNGTQGNVIPNGAKVRIPNVHFTMEIPRSPIMAAISSATAGNLVTYLVGNVSNLQASTGMGFLINQEEFTGTFSGSTMTTTARALNGTVAANHAQGDVMFNVQSITATTTNNRAIFDVTDGGIVNLSKCSFGNVFITLANGQASTINNVWVTGAASIGSTTADITINGLVTSPFPAGDSGTTIQNILGSLSAERVYSSTTLVGTNASSATNTIQNNQNVIKLESIEGFLTTRNGNSTAQAIACNTNILNCIPTNLRCIGGRLAMSNTSSFEVDGIQQSSESSGVISSNVAMSAIVVANCQNGIYRNVTKSTNGAAVRNQVITTDANCANIIFHTINYDCAANSSAIISPQGNNITVANGTFGTPRDATGTTSGGFAMSNSSTGDTVVIRNCQFTMSDTYGADNGNGEVSRIFLEQTSGHSMWWRTAGNAFAGNYQEMGPYHTLLDNGTKATGTLFAQFSPKASRDIYTLNGNAYLNNGGSVLLPTTGDYIILKSYNDIRTVTGFTGTVVAEDVNDANLTFGFELIHHEATFANVFTPLTTANLNAALAEISGYDSADGFKLQIKITAIADSATNQVINIRMFTTNNAAVVLPIGYTAYTLTGLTPNSTVAVYDGATEVDYIASASGSAVLQLPYSYNGLYATDNIKVRCLDCVWDDHTVTFNQYALSRASLQTADTEVTVTNVATVAAYTNLDTPQKIYDYIKYWGSLRANLNVSKPCTKLGTALNFGSLNVVLDATAAQNIVISGGTITIKSSGLNGGSLVTTGTISLVNGAVTGTTLLTGSNGKSGLLSLTGLTSTAIYVKDNSGTQFDYVASTTGSYSKVIPFGSTGSWSAVTKRKGYRHAYSNFTANTGGNFLFSPSMPEKLNPDGSSMYLGTSSVLVSVSFTGTTQANIDIGNGTASLQNTFDETEDALETNAGMIWLAASKSDCSQFNSAGGDYLFLSTGWRLRRATAGDVNATLTAFAVSADGTVVDGVNGGVQFLTSDSPTAIAAAVWAHVSRTLTANPGLTLANIEASTILAKEATVATKASQTSVNAIPTTPLLAASYTAPDNTSILAIKAKTDTLVNTNLTGISTTVEVNAARDAVIAALPAAAPSASTVASTVWSNATRTLSSTSDSSGVTTLLSRVSGNAMLASSYVAPDNANIALIKAKTDTLVNTDLTGIATSANVSSAQAAIIAEIDGIPSITVGDIWTNPTRTLTANPGITVANIEASTILAKEATVAAKASQASVNALGTPMQAGSYVAPANADIDLIKSGLTVVNEGVKLASNIIPHSTNLPY